MAGTDSQGLRIVLITQDDVFYLPDAIAHLLGRIAPHQVVGCVVLGMSVFGRDDAAHKKILKTWRIFGGRFLLHYGVAFVLARIRRGDIRALLRRAQIAQVVVAGTLNAKATRLRIAEYKPDIIISVAANEIFSKELLSIPRLGTLNLHSGLLPRYRGLLPTFWAMKNAEKEIGISVVLMDEGIDSGEVLVQRRIPFSGQSHAEVIRATKHLGMEALVTAVSLLQKGRYERSPNESTNATYYSFPRREDVKEFIAMGNRFY